MAEKRASEQKAEAGDAIKALLRVGGQDKVQAGGFDIALSVVERRTVSNELAKTMIEPAVYEQISKAQISVILRVTPSRE